MPMPSPTGRTNTQDCSSGDPREEEGPPGETVSGQKLLSGKTPLEKGVTWQGALNAGYVRMATLIEWKSPSCISMAAPTITKQKLNCAESSTNSPGMAH